MFRICAADFFNASICFIDFLYLAKTVIFAFGINFSNVRQIYYFVRLVLNGLDQSLSQRLYPADISKYFTEIPAIHDSRNEIKVLSIRRGKYLAQKSFCQ